jgi:hypothetical protein
MEPAQVRMPDAEAYPNWLVPVALICGVPFFFWFTFRIGNQLQGFVAMLSAASVSVAFITLRQWRSYISFWLSNAINVFAHCFIVFATPNFDSHFPGIIFSPLLIADFLFWQFFTVLIIRSIRR